MIELNPNTTSRKFIRVTSGPKRDSMEDAIGHRSLRTPVWSNPRTESGGDGQKSGRAGRVPARRENRKKPESRRLAYFFLPYLTPQP
jgi:hypothetical protein